MTLRSRRGPFLEDFSVGDVYRSRLGRTVSEADNTWFTLLTMNTNQIHFNAPFAEGTEFGAPLVVSSLTLAIVLGLSVADTSENAAANLGWGDIRLPTPGVRRRHAVGGVGDPERAGVELAPRLRNRRSAHARRSTSAREVVIEFTRSFMVFKRAAPEVADNFPVTDAPWTVS